MLASGLLAAWWTYPRARDERTRQLLADASRGALAFLDSDLLKLDAVVREVGTPGYERLKRKLTALRLIDPRVRFCYIMRRLPDGTVVFLADSEPPESADVSLPGDVYAEAAESYGLQALLRTGMPHWEGPLADEFGTWVTGFAVASRDEGGAIRDVFGLDVDAADWAWSLWAESLKSAFYTWLVTGLPVAIGLLSRRRLHMLSQIRQLSDALDQSSAAVIMVNLDGTLRYVNGGFFRQTGIPSEQALGRNWRRFAPRNMKRRTMLSVFSALKRGRPWYGQWESYRQDGSIYPVYGVVTLVRDVPGRVTGYLVVFDDLSVVKKTEEELRVAKEQAEAANQAKSRFLATMSHEIRTPLNGIIGVASVLHQLRMPPDQRELVDVIRRSGETLLVIINDILDISRIESGKVELDIRTFDTRAIIDEVASLFRSVALSKNVSLAVKHADGAPPFAVGDAGRLRQIVSNLISNGLKFTERGEVRVETRVLERSDKGFLWCVEVSDTGIGIPEAKLDRLFAPFSQLDASITRRFGGTGLGLAICKRLCELMGGEIRVRSRVGQGSVFEVRVRLEVGKAPVITPAEPVVVDPVHGEARVLLVEDNAVNRIVAQRMLALLGHKADAVTDGEQAVEACRQHGYDIIFMDLEMPNLDGLSATRAIRSLDLPQQPWIIALTAEALVGDRDKCLSVGMDDYLSKPLMTEALQKVLDRAYLALPARQCA